MGRERGRPTDCTPELADEVAAELEAVPSVRAACAVVGISQSAYYDWLSRADAGEGAPFREFAERVRAAKERGIAHAARRVHRAAVDGDWRADAWLLERVAPDEFSTRVRTEVTGADGGAVQAQVQVVWSDALGAACAGEGGDG